MFSPQLERDLELNAGNSCCHRDASNSKQFEIKGVMTTLIKLTVKC